MVSVGTACEQDKVFKAIDECAAESCKPNSEAQSAQIHKPKEIPMSSTTVVKDPVCGVDRSINAVLFWTDYGFPRCNPDIVRGGSSRTGEMAVNLG
jgi:hypothetical protein